MRPISTYAPPTSTVDVGPDREGEATSPVRSSPRRGSVGIRSRTDASAGQSIPRAANSSPRSADINRLALANTGSQSAPSATPELPPLVEPPMIGRLGLTRLIEAEVPLPDDASDADRINVENQRQERGNALMQRAQPLIAAMASRSPVIRERRSVSSSLTRLKPISEQYKYAKALPPQDRMLLAAALEEIILGRRSGAVNVDEALELRESVRHAQLRFHAPRDRLQLRLRNAVRATGTVALSLAVTPYLIAAPADLVHGLRTSRRNYDRSDDRPEYMDAFNGAMDLMRAPSLSMDRKRRIAGMLLDQHIRRERTIAARDQNALLRSVVPNGAQVPQQGHTTIRAPRVGNGAQENALRDAIIHFAEGGYLSSPPAPTVTAVTVPSDLSLISDVTGAYWSLPAVKLSEFERMGFSEGNTTCAISLDELSSQNKDDMLVAIRGTARLNAGIESPEATFYKFSELVKWINQNNGSALDPVTRQKPLTLATLKDHVIRVASPVPETLVAEGDDQASSSGVKNDQA